MIVLIKIMLAHFIGDFLIQPPSWVKALTESDDESLKNAGRYICILERLFVFRFGDLKESKDRKLTEYILIGTLLSFGLAMAAGVMVVKLTQS